MGPTKSLFLSAGLLLSTMGAFASELPEITLYKSAS